MRMLIGLLEIVHVVGDDEIEVEIPGDRRQADVDDPLVVDLVQTYF